MILTSGCFDGLHAGHVEYLQAAKALCAPDELLFCAVAPDAYIRAEKHREPHWSQTERVLVVRECRSVDVAFHQCEPTVADIIRQYRPRMFVKGCDWHGCLPDDVIAACIAHGVKIQFTETMRTHTSDILGVPV